MKVRKLQISATACFYILNKASGHLSRYAFYGFRILVLILLQLVIGHGNVCVQAIQLLETNKLRLLTKPICLPRVVGMIVL